MKLLGLKIRTFIVSIIFLLFLTESSLALIPEPDNLFYGTVKIGDIEVKEIKSGDKVIVNINQIVPAQRWTE